MCESIADVHSHACKTGEPTDEAQKLLQEFDVDCSGNVELDEFLQFYKRHWLVVEQLQLPKDLCQLRDAAKLLVVQLMGTRRLTKAIVSEIVESVVEFQRQYLFTNAEAENFVRQQIDAVSQRNMRNNLSAMSRSQRLEH